MRESLGRSLSEQLDAEAASFAACAGTPDFAEGIAAFLEKRPRAVRRDEAPLAGKTLFITGGSRGIGLAIALRAARDGANVAIAAKTVAPHPKLPGTIFTAAEEIERAGGHAPADRVRHPRRGRRARRRRRKRRAQFGGIDILVNNASAISLTGTLDTPMKRFDLMHRRQRARHVPVLAGLRART